MPDKTEIDADFSLPPATFSFLVESILMQAQIQLGVFSLNTGEEPEEPNLPLARHSIDLLSVLNEKTRGNTTGEEQRLIENGLTELRFRYVQVSEERKQIKRKAVGQTKDQPMIVTSDGGKGSRSV